MDSKHTVVPFVIRAGQGKHASSNGQKHVVTGQLAGSCLSTSTMQTLQELVSDLQVVLFATPAGPIAGLRR